MFDFDNWGSWGLIDFYDDTKEELSAAIDSDQDFDTGWHGFKKTEYSLRIVRRNGSTTVSVSDCMDSAFDSYDLFCDFLADDELDRLTDETVSGIRDALMCGNFVEETTESESLPCAASFGDIVTAAERLANGCERKLLDSFKECIAVTLYALYGDSATEIIKERTKECA